MPRGVPTAGFRNRRPKMHSGASALKIMEQINRVPVVSRLESDNEIDTRIKDRFDILEEMVEASMIGEVRSLIVSGPPGLGKSYTVEEKLKASVVPNRIFRGYLRPPALYKLLYQNRMAGQVLVFDDADAVFAEDTSLNLLKAVCDSTEQRVVSYMTETVLVDEESAEIIPKTFEFNGTVIFITNLDMDLMIERGHRLAVHLQALISRSHYIFLGMRNARDFLIRIKQIQKRGLLASRGLNESQQAEVMEYIEEKQLELRELSLRMAIKLADIRHHSGSAWKRIANITCCREK